MFEYIKNLMEGIPDDMEA